MSPARYKLLADSNTWMEREWGPHLTSVRQMLKSHQH